MDERETGPTNDLDARADLDARPTETLDSALAVDAAFGDGAHFDTGAVCEEWNVCRDRETAGVACDTSICSGATPNCCRNDFRNTFECVTADRTYGCADPSPMSTAGVALLCDEAGDCAPGEICVDALRKGAGFGFTEGARCRRICAPSAPYAFQVCRRDCECAPGHPCRDGQCALRR